MKAAYLAFIDKLRAVMENDLPGVTAHAKMSPAHRRVNPEFLIPSASYKTAAVLALLFPDKEDGAPRIVLIERAHGLDVHARQISFPGGKQEAQEELSETALRETFEEIGILSSQVQIIGPLTSLFIPPSNFKVFPFLGILDDDPVFKINPTEVNRVLTPFLTHFLKLENVTSASVSSSLGSVNAPCYLVDEAMIWGATAMMMSEIIEIVKAAGSLAK